MVHRGWPVYVGVLDADNRLALLASAWLHVAECIPLSLSVIWHCIWWFRVFLYLSLGGLGYYGFLSPFRPSLILLLLHASLFSSCLLGVLMFF